MKSPGSEVVCEGMTNPKPFDLKDERSVLLRLSRCCEKPRRRTTEGRKRYSGSLMSVHPRRNSSHHGGQEGRKGERKRICFTSGLPLFSSSITPALRGCHPCPGWVCSQLILSGSILTDILIVYVNIHISG